MSALQAKSGLVLSNVRTPGAPSGSEKKKKKKSGSSTLSEYGLAGYVELGF